MGMSGGGLTAGLARRRGRAPMSEINVTPLVDVMLVLLIVFMVTAPLLTAGIKLDLPKAGGAPLADQQKPVIVSVDAAGGVHLGPDTVTLTDLVARLAAETPDRDARIYLRGDTTTDYGHIAEVMGALAAAGYGRVALVTIAREPN